jgi:hypothetical protein
MKKNLQTIPEIKPTFQQEIKEISTEILTEILNNFVIRFHKVHDFRQHQMEHILV